VSDSIERTSTNEEGSVIDLDSISVRYRVPQERFGTFKEYLIRRFQGRVNHKDFWALKDVSLRIKRGEVFGIVGRNGAGKSTMLKVVSRVLRPTTGRVRIVGRVSPLLELGAAFHHELNGRENVFLNASLLGYSQKEVVERFSKIVEFADIGDFIDAPLRTYSTGMVARLGFSVATAWEPDILVLDEVLSVGDEAFQAKCHERITYFRENGATVLLVSHDARVVRSICQRAAWIEQGEIQAIGEPEEIVDLYRGDQSG
jgi:ABC-type polysaccharide/polyol phosphate transport system ATPase subunit